MVEVRPFATMDPGLRQGDGRLVDSGLRGSALRAERPAHFFWSMT
jgi:hypothetical protein